MTLYIVRGDRVAAHASAPARASAAEFASRSANELEASALSNAQLAALLECAAGDVRRSRSSRTAKTAVRYLWVRFGQLPGRFGIEAGGAAGPRAGSKQAQVIDLLQRPDGATVDELATAMGWQRHTVRGLITGALKKKLGLDVVSEKTDRG